MRLTAQDIEIAVAKYFNYRINLIVPNVSWGWNLHHEADMIVLRPSGYCDEIEIKVTRSDIIADTKKLHSHWESTKIARVWFAVPHTLADCEHIPTAAGILSICRGCFADDEGRRVWRAWQPGDTTWQDHVEVVRPAKLRSKDTRVVVSSADRQKLAELGAMRIWDLKSALAKRKGGGK